jgi:hypothetical protein
MYVPLNIKVIYVCMFLVQYINCILETCTKIPKCMLPILSVVIVFTVLCFICIVYQHCKLHIQICK